MKRLLSLVLLALSAAAAIAGQVCTIDPPRPAGATGTGFYIAQVADAAATAASNAAPAKVWKLFDPTGTEFRIRGANRTHYDSFGTDKGFPLTGANTQRLAPGFSRGDAVNLASLKTLLDAGITPIPSNWAGTCKSDPAALTAIVDTWVAQAAVWTTLNANGLVNIANEWGPGSTTSVAVPYKPNISVPNYVWRDNSIAAVLRMRAANYLMPLVIDAGSCGQDAQTIIRDGAAVLAADPQHNLVFSVHVYGGFYLPATASYQQDYAKTMAALKATGLPILIGEFGPGRNIGPSPTMIAPETIVATAEANGWGWAAWSWDDNNLAGCAANDSWFSMTTKCGTYTGVDTDLTTFGRTVVPLYRAYGAMKAKLQ